MTISALTLLTLKPGESTGREFAKCFSVIVNLYRVR